MLPWSQPAPRPYARQAVTATFVGSVTADLALMLSDRTFLDEAAGGMAGGQLGVVSVTDVLRPAMESASSVFGAGVLSDLRESDASGLLSDPDTAVFELSDGTSPAAGSPSGCANTAPARTARATSSAAATRWPAGWAASTTSRWP